MKQGLKPVGGQDICHWRGQNHCQITQVLIDAYNYMRECGASKDGVKQFVDHMVYQKEDDLAKVEAYQWLLGVFDGPSVPVVPDGQMQLF